MLFRSTVTRKGSNAGTFPSTCGCRITLGCIVVSAFPSPRTCRTDDSLRYGESHPGTDALSRIDQAAAAFRHALSRGGSLGLHGLGPAYEIFTGCAEVAGGLLLIVPRTATLGALISLADMSQVDTLNMTYDVPANHSESPCNPQQRFIMCCETARIVTTWSLFHCSDS